MNTRTESWRRCRTPEQKAELTATMEPLFQQAEASGKWLRNGYFDDMFSPAHLRHLQAKGEYVQGPRWWSLVDRPRFTQHQGEWDTLTIEEHEALDAA